MFLSDVFIDEMHLKTRYCYDAGTLTVVILACLELLWVCFDAYHRSIFVVIGNNSIRIANISIQEQGSSSVVQTCLSVLCCYSYLHKNQEQ